MYLGSWNRTTEPLAYPITVEDASDFCRIDSDDTASTATVERLIKRTTAHVEERIGRQLITASWTLKLDYFPCVIQLPRPPLIDVTSIRYVDTDGVTQTLSSALYQVQTSCEPGRILPAYGVAWPATRCQPDAVTIIYRAGYGADGDSVPQGIIGAMEMLIAHWNANREAVITGSNQADISQGVDELLANYEVQLI